MHDVQQSILHLPEYLKRTKELAVLLKIEEQQTECVQLSRELENPEIWSDQKKICSLSQRHSLLKRNIQEFRNLNDTLQSLDELVQWARKEGDEDDVSELVKELSSIDERIRDLEFKLMFNGELDSHSCYVEIQSGSGGTEAQDWTEMLLRQYIRWTERHDLKTEVLERSEGEVAGIKSASIHVIGDYAYGWLRTETGIHRLVRKSPFDSGNRRHTSFASVFVSPEIDDSFEIDINPVDIRVDVYRASGAGGQHVNRTESAVRLTHMPTDTVTQCQNSRSQHSNKAEAMKQLRAKLYELEIKRRNAKKQQLENNKDDIGWGNQIRSYILDSGRIKDLRTGVETGNTQAVLDGNLDMFIEASLKMEI